MAPTIMLACAVVLLCMTYSIATNGFDSEETQMRRFDHLKHIAEGVNWKPIIEPSEDELKAIESKARRQSPPEFAKNTLKTAKAACQPGYTGDDCSSPICYNTSTIIYHDGDADLGDTIEWDSSPACNDTRYFPLDNYINDVYITLLASGNAGPSGQLLDPNGEEVTPTEIQQHTPTKWLAKYASLVEGRGAGSYSFVLQSGATASCIYSVQATTALYCDGGFITDPRDDNVQTENPEGNNGIERMPVQNVPSYLAFAVKNEIWPIQTLSVAFYGNGVFSKSFPVKIRYNCAAPNFAGAFTCTQFGIYHAKIRGIDNRANIWQRVYYFDCLPGQLSTTVGPTGPTTTPVPPTLCYNNGQLLNGGTSSAYCYCPPYFTGNMCQTKLCFNGGSLNSDKECVCVDDWSGPHCTDAKCETNSDIPFDLRFRALVFIVRTSLSMDSEFAQITQAARDITTFYLTNHAEYFVVYVLATFINGTIPIVQQFTDPNEFLGALASLTASPGGCDDVVFSTLSAVLQLPALAQYHRSPIFVFTDGVASDGFDQLENTFNLLSYWRGQVFTVLTDPANGCSIDTASPGYRLYQQIARFSQGHVSYLPKATSASIVTALANSLYRMDYALSNDLLTNCRNAPTYQPFFVDSDTKYVIITATGTSLSLTITDPMLNRTSVTPSLSQNGTYIWTMMNPMVGGYLMSINGAAAPCQYRVLVRSSLDLFFGVSSTLNTDAISPQPIYMDSHIVAHLNGLNRSSITDNFNAEVTITTNDANGNRVALYASNGLYRDGCSYFLYFGNWQCQRPFDEFYITVYGKDNKGKTFQRVSTGFCSAKQPPIIPPNGCLNSGVDGPNGTCICPPHFFGPKCQNIQCLNGGSVTSGICFCPPGFTGQFCEQTMCYNRNPDDQFSPNERSLTYIIQNSLRMRPVIQGLQQTAARLTQELSQQHPRWINFYQLIGFSDQGYKVYTESGSPSDFVAGLGALITDNKQNASYACKNLSIFESINYALSSVQASRYGFIFVFTGGQAAMDLTVLSEMYEKAFQSKAQINFIQTDSRPCGLHLTDTGISIQMDIPVFTGGNFFPLSPIRAALINSYIPTLYSGNFVYENFVSDCSKPQSFYFPIDSHTQAYTIYTEGQLVNTGNIINTPQGTPYQSSNIINLWSDAILNTRVDQVIKACDPTWEDIVSDGNCYKFNFKPMTWADARAACHAEGAVLINIYTSAFENTVDNEADVVDYWTGLNDNAQEGQFVWDQLNGSIPLDPNGYKNWAPGQPAPDPGHLSNCVVDKRNNADGTGVGWVPINCNVTKNSVCVKRNYNYTYEPSSDENSERCIDNCSPHDILPPGIWSVTVQTQSGACYVRVNSQSSIQLFYEYVINTHNDAGNAEPTNGADDNRMIAHITHQESTLGIEGQLQYLHMYRDNLTVYDVETFELRSDCAYEYISTPFRCPKFSFQAMVTGIDSFGYLYQRIKPATCISGATPGSCLHGGVYNNGQCYCPQYYTGDHCEKAVCVHGGTLAANNEACKCPIGYAGQFCELPQCIPIVPHETLSVDNRTFVLVLDGASSSAMGSINMNINKTLTGVLQYVTGIHSQWFTRFVGVVFLDADAPSLGRNITSATIESTDMTDFINRISAAVAVNYTAPHCPRAILTGLTQALASSFILPRSEVFVLTAGSAADGITQLLPAVNAITQTHAYVNFITISDSGAPCNVSYNDPTVAAMFSLAQISGGGYYQITSDALTSFWSYLTSSFYGSSWLTFNNFNNCANITQYVQVGANSSLITFDIFSVDKPTISVLNPNRTSEKPNELYAGNHTTLDQVSVSKMPGIYTLQVNSGSSTEQGKQCLIKVRGQSQLRVFFAFTQDVDIDDGVHSDQTSLAPASGTNANALVATTNGGQLTYVHFLSLFDGSLLWSSRLQLRDSCAYEYISDIFTCPTSSFAVAISGVDYEGHPIRRMGNVHCVGQSVPTFAPPNGTVTSTTPPATSPPSTMPTTTTTPAPTTTTPLPQCALDAAAGDLFLLFDSSSAIAPSDYTTIILSFADMGNTLTIRPNNVRVALGTYDSSPHFLDADFNVINSSTDYVGKLLELYRKPTAGVFGNNIDDALSAILNLTTPEHGYRTGPNITNMIVLFSSTGWDQGNGGQGFADPSATALKLRKAGMNIVAVGFGPDANMPQLQQISPCAQAIARTTALGGLKLWLYHRFCLTGLFC